MIKINCLKQIKNQEYIDYIACFNITDISYIYQVTPEQYRIITDTDLNLLVDKFIGKKIAKHHAAGGKFKKLDRDFSAEQISEKQDTDFNRFVKNDILISQGYMDNNK